jgi:hypothetical protein
MRCAKTALLKFQPPWAMLHSNIMSVYLVESATKIDLLELSVKGQK